MSVSACLGGRESKGGPHPLSSFSVHSFPTRPRRQGLKLLLLPLLSQLLAQVLRALGLRDGLEVCEMERDAVR